MPMQVLKDFVKQAGQEVYAHQCFQDETGVIYITVRSNSALLINSEQAKRAAKQAQVMTPGYDQRGLEQWGGAYLFDLNLGKLCTDCPHMKEGESLPANLVYERKYRLNPAL
jgi:hypothetical protein